MCPGLQVARSALNLIHVKKCPGKSKREILDYNIKVTACDWVIIYKVNINKGYVLGYKYILSPYQSSP